MPQTQTMYLGDVPVIKNYLGNNPISTVTTIPPYQIEYLVYAAGGTGGNRVSTQSGGGGGAGGLLSGSLTITPFETYQVAVGFPTSTNGQDSYFTGSNAYIYAFGGGKGGNGGNQNGSNGGSGGGGGGTSSTGGTGVSGQGFAGKNSAATSGAGGGGAGGTGTGDQIDGGPGRTSSISGISRTYCAGGRAQSADRGNNVSGSGGFGGMTGFETGTQGGSGEVIIRYLGPQKGAGGVVTTDGSYVIHTFSTSGSATYTG
jgi:hypothetical protein